MLFFEMRIQIFKEKLFGLLQSPPAGGRLIGEGFACSHGCIFLSRFRVRYLHKTQIHPLPTLLHNNSYATPCTALSRFGSQLSLLFHTFFPMKVVSAVAAMQRLALQWKAKRKQVALVPTMGYLHGHHVS